MMGEEQKLGENNVSEREKVNSEWEQLMEHVKNMANDYHRRPEKEFHHDVLSLVVFLLAIYRDLKWIRLYNNNADEQDQTRLLEERWNPQLAVRRPAQDFRHTVFLTYLPRVEGKKKKVQRETIIPHHKWELKDKNKSDATDQNLDIRKLSYANSQKDGGEAMLKLNMIEISLKTNSQDANSPPRVALCLVYEVNKSPTLYLLESLAYLVQTQVQPIAPTGQKDQLDVDIGKCSDEADDSKSSLKNNEDLSCFIEKKGMQREMCRRKREDNLHGDSHKKPCINEETNIEDYKNTSQVSQTEFVIAPQSQQYHQASAVLQDDAQQMKASEQEVLEQLKQKVLSDNYDDQKMPEDPAQLSKYKENYAQLSDLLRRKDTRASCSSVQKQQQVADDRAEASATRAFDANGTISHTGTISGSQMQGNGFRSLPVEEEPYIMAGPTSGGIEQLKENMYSQNKYHSGVCNLPEQENLDKLTGSIDEGSSTFVSTETVKQASPYKLPMEAVNTPLSGSPNGKETDWSKFLDSVTDAYKSRQDEIAESDFPEDINKDESSSVSIRDEDDKDRLVGTLPVKPIGTELGGFGSYEALQSLSDNIDIEFS